MATERPSWAEHAAAAAAMGLTPREALDMWECGWPGLVRASRERRKAFAAYLDAHEATTPEERRRALEAMRDESES